MRALALPCLQHIYLHESGWRTSSLAPNGTPLKLAQGTGSAAYAIFLPLRGRSKYSAVQTAYDVACYMFVPMCWWVTSV